MLITHKVKTEIIKMAKLADSSLDAAIILLDFGKRQDAFYCVVRAVEYKMLTLLMTRTEDLPRKAGILSEFENCFRKTELTEEVDLGALKGILSYDLEQHSIMDELEAKSLTSEKTMRLVSIFFRRCDSIIRDAVKGKKKTAKHVMSPSGGVKDNIEGERSKGNLKRTVQTLMLPSVIIGAILLGLIGSFIFFGPQNSIQEEPAEFACLSIRLPPFFGEGVQLFFQPCCGSYIPCR